MLALNVTSYLPIPVSWIFFAYFPYLRMPPDDTAAVPPGRFALVFAEAKSGVAEIEVANMANAATLASSLRDMNASLQASVHPSDRIDTLKA